MKRGEFLELIARFVEKPIPATFARHIYLWIGGVEDLLVESPTGFIKTLDLHFLCKGLTKTPFGDKAAGRELSDAIDGWLLREFPQSQSQRALLITGLDLVYRYRLSMSAFVRLANENTLIILSMPSIDAHFHPIKPLPGYIQFSPDAILEYAASEIPEEAIVKEE